MYKPYLTALLLLIVSGAFAQGLVPGQSYYNANNYAEYIYGTLPVIISAPHGGRLKPAGIPDRTSACGDDIVTVLDTNTQELARALDSALAALTGQHPHTVICRLSRQKMDANRALAEAACGNAVAGQTWYDYQAFIDSSVQRVLRQYGRGLFIDLHGHGHDIARNEIGYLLSGAELRAADSVINGPDYTTESSIRYLAWNNAGALGQAALLRGPQAFGTLLANSGYPSVPSQQDPYPLEGQSYFNGGYNTARWGSRNGGRIDAFQIETNYDSLRDNAVHIHRFADTLAHVIQRYMGLHFSAPDTPSPLSATALTPGHLLVGRFLTGATTAQKISLLEIDTGSHAVVQAIDLPASGPYALTLTNVVTDGQLALAADSSCVTLTGYFLDEGANTSITNSGVNRAVGKLGPATDLTAYILPNSSVSSEYGDPYNASNIRNAFTPDGHRFYTAGGSTSTTNTTTGVWTFTDSTLRTAEQLTALPNSRWGTAMNGRLYLAAQSITGTAQGIYRLDGGDTVRLFTPAGGSVISFVFSPDSSTCYVCVNSSSVHVEKWRRAGSSWSYQYRIQPTGISTAPRAMTARFTGTAANLFLVYATQVVRITDSIANTASGALSTAPTVIYTETAAGTALRGICFTPSASMQNAVQHTGNRLALTGKTMTALKVYPNPVSGGEIIIRHEKAGTSALIRLVTLNGRVQQQARVAVGNVQTILPATRLPAGVYVVYYYNNGVVATAKLIKSLTNE